MLYQRSMAMEVIKRLRFYIFRTCINTSFCYLRYARSEQLRKDNLSKLGRRLDIGGLELPAAERYALAGLRTLSSRSHIFRGTSVLHQREVGCWLSPQLLLVLKLSEESFGPDVSRTLVEDSILRLREASGHLSTGVLCRIGTLFLTLATFQIMSIAMENKELDSGNMKSETKDQCQETLADPSDRKTSSTRREYVQLAALYWTMFMAGWNDGSAGPMLPRMETVYNVSVSTLVWRVYTDSCRLIIRSYLSSSCSPVWYVRVLSADLSSTRNLRCIDRDSYLERSLTSHCLRSLALGRCSFWERSARWLRTLYKRGLPHFLHLSFRTLSMAWAWLSRSVRFWARVQLLIIDCATSRMRNLTDTWPVWRTIRRLR